MAFFAARSCARDDEYSPQEGYLMLFYRKHFKRRRKAWNEKPQEGAKKFVEANEAEAREVSDDAKEQQAFPSTKKHKRKTP